MLLNKKDTDEGKVKQDVARSLVEEYGYNKSDIDIEFPIKMGRARKRADIVVFYESKEHTQGGIFMILEIKTENIKLSDRKEGVNQLASYITGSPNSSFALWVGNERLAFKLIEERRKRFLAQIPDMPKRGETTIPKPTRESLVPALGCPRQTMN